nr:MAG TPA: hypothetical protein [Bacteriophage sp.]
MHLHILVKLLLIKYFLFHNIDHLFLINTTNLKLYPNNLLKLF